LSCEKKSRSPCANDCYSISAEEAGSYIERYKAFEHKAPDLIRERVNNDYMSHLNSALTNIKGVNKTDVITLATNFGVSRKHLTNVVSLILIVCCSLSFLQSFKRIAEATSEELSQCPGFGATKVKRVRDVFQQPFRVGETRTGRERRAERQRLYGNGAPSSNGSKGRFIEDDDDIEGDEDELQQQRQNEEGENLNRTIEKQPTVTNPSSYVAPKTNGTAIRAGVDPNEEEDVENAGENEGSRREDTAL
jgi:DNA excision repair protein ERCC-1